MQYSVLVLVLYFFANYIITPTTAQDGNDVVYSGPSIVREGDSFQLRCRMSVFDAPRWTRNGRPIPETEGNHFERHADRAQTRTELFSVWRASLQDTGDYRCNSFSRNYHRLDVVPRLVRHGADSEAKKQKKIPGVDLVEGETVKLACDVEGSEGSSGIFWYHNGSRLENDRRHQIDGAEVTIIQATKRDVGDYLCTVILRSGAHAGQIVQLRGPVKTQPFPPRVQVQAGTSFELKCEYEGYPVPALNWYVGNEPVLDNSDDLDVEIVSDDSGHPNALLRMANVTAGHRNRYACVADNTFSQSESSTFFTVRATPIETNELEPGRGIVLREGAPLVLQCNLTTAESPNAFMPLRWHRDDELLEEDFDSLKYQMFPFNYSLVVYDAQVEDVADYRCEFLVNPAVSEMIKVRAKPRPEEFHEWKANDYKSANLVEGERFELECKVKPGYERDAEVRWLKYPEDDKDSVSEVLESENVRFLMNESSLILILDPIRPEDRAYYVCKSDNLVAVANVTILIRVKDRMAALWPFLIIVGEVILLVTLILLCDRKPKKPGFDETPETVKPAERKTPPERARKDWNVRQRK